MWIGVELEGTLASKDHKPNLVMVKKIQNMLKNNETVKLLTHTSKKQAEQWQQEHFNILKFKLPVIKYDLPKEIWTNTALPAVYNSQTKEVFRQMQTLPETPIIDFDNAPASKTQPSMPVQKKWDFHTPITSRKLVKTTLIRQQLRITLPKEIINLAQLDTSYHLYLTALKAKGCIEIRITKDKIPNTEYDYLRKLSPIGTGLLCFYIPRLLRNQIDDGHLHSVWLMIPTNITPDEHLVLEIYPA